MNAFLEWLNTGTTLAEIAKREGVSEAAISKRFTRILNKNRKRMDMSVAFEDAKQKK